MISKQSNDTSRHEISVRVKEQHNEGQTIRKKNYKSNKYSKFDQERREEVIFWCHFAVFLLAAGICVASFTLPSLKKATPRGLAMWKWSLLITVLLGGPLVSKAILRFILFLLDREFSAKENVIYYVVGLIESAWVVLWFSMILIAWLWVVDEPKYLGLPPQEKARNKQKFASTFPIVTTTLITMILGSFFWLLKEAVLMMTKSSFHIRRFFVRVKEALRHQRVINTLCHHDKVVELSYTNQDLCHKIRRLGSKSEKKKVFNLSCLDEVTEEDVSNWGMKIVIDWIRKNPDVTYKDDGKMIVIDGEEEAIRAANSIYFKVVENEETQQVNSPNSYIKEEELQRYLNLNNKDQLFEVINCLLEGADRKQITKEILVKWMVKAFRYRKALARALEANKRLFQVLNSFVNVLLILFITVLWLIMLKIKTRNVIFAIATAIAGSAFIFDQSTKKLLENLLFVFFVHPFDIGDCCLIDNIPVIIEEINVFTTIVLTFDNEMKHYPNVDLASKSIINYTRSSNIGDFVEISLNVDMPIEKIEYLKDQIMRYINDSQYWNKEHYWVITLEDASNMKLRLQFQHPKHYHGFKERQIKKTALVLEIKTILEKLMQTTNE